jgi:hypothetical protein
MWIVDYWLTFLIRGKGIQQVHEIARKLFRDSPLLTIAGRFQRLEALEHIQIGLCAFTKPSFSQAVRFDIE